MMLFILESRRFGLLSGGLKQGAESFVRLELFSSSVGVWDFAWKV